MLLSTLPEAWLTLEQMDFLADVLDKGCIRILRGLRRPRCHLHGQSPAARSPMHQEAMPASFSSLTTKGISSSSGNSFPLLFVRFRKQCNASHFEFQRCHLTALPEIINVHLKVGNAVNFGNWLFDSTTVEFFKLRDILPL